MAMDPYEDLEVWSDGELEEELALITAELSMAEKQGSEEQRHAMNVQWRKLRRETRQRRLKEQGLVSVSCVFRHVQ